MKTKTIKRSPAKKNEYKTVWEFYPFYLSEHAHPVNRTLHFIGTSLVILEVLYILFSAQFGLFPFIPITG